MNTISETAVRDAVRRSFSPSMLHAHEGLLLAFFCILGIAGHFRPLTAAQRASLIGVPCLLFTFWVWEGTATRPWTRVVRQWTSLGLILPAYWILAWFSAGHATGVQEVWNLADRVLLDSVGLRGLIESSGSVFPRLLETLYLLLYCLPPAALGILQYYGQGIEARRFLFILFLGTLSAYLLIPVLPVASPRIAFPSEDASPMQGFPRPINVWILDHLDISTSVFPSGHVAVAFSCAFGLLRTLRSRPWVWITSIVIAALVLVATVYGRYHYAADGLASLAIATIAWRLERRIFPE